jgi:hypothetical protein
VKPGLIWAGVEAVTESTWELRDAEIRGSAGMAIQIAANLRNLIKILNP